MKFSSKTRFDKKSEDKSKERPREQLMRYASHRTQPSLQLEESLNKFLRPLPITKGQPDKRKTTEQELNQPSR